jgi:ATP-dependent Clp protease protease subunit
MDHQKNFIKQDNEDESPASPNANPFAELVYETYQELKEERIILINGDLTESIIEKAVVPLMQMGQEKDPIQLWINSFGGTITDSQAVCDVIRGLDNPIIAMVFGKAMSAAFDILCASDYRIAYPNSLMMCHAGSESLGVQTLPAINVEAKLHEEYFSRWSKFYAERTKIVEKEWLDLLNSGKNRYFFPQEALQKGIIHHIVSPGKKPPLAKVLKMKW